LRAGRFAQRLSESLHALQGPLLRYQEIDLIAQWRATLIEALLLSLTRYLNATHQYKLAEVYTHPERSLPPLDDTKGWVSLPLRFCWLLIISGKRDAEHIQDLTREQRLAYLNCRVLFVQHLTSFPEDTSIHSESSDALHIHLDQALDILQKCDDFTPDHLLDISTDELKYLAYRQLGLSFTLAIVAGSLTAWSMLSSISIFMLSAFTFAWFTFNQLQSQSSRSRPIQSSVDKQANQLAPQLVDHILLGDERWSTLKLSRDSVEDQRSYEHLRSDFEQYQQDYNDLSHALSVIMTQDHSAQ